MEDGTKFKGGKKTEKAVGYFIQWLDIEQHVFTRVKLLLIFNKLLQGLPPSIFEKKNPKIAESLMRQWVEKKVFKQVTPILLLLWTLVGDIGKWTGAVSSTLESANPVVKGAFWLFLYEAATQNPGKAKAEYWIILFISLSRAAIPLGENF